MLRKLRPLLFILQFVVVGLAAAFLISLAWPGVGGHLRESLHGGRPATVDPRPASDTPAHGPASYAGAVAKAAPAVVNIYADKTVTERPLAVFPDPILQRLWGGMAGPALKRREQSLGSGVIFTSDGYVLTNNHVISGADDIQVLLHDGRVAHARVIGTDPDTDLAVLKIDLDRLPAIAFGRNEALQVGDVVLAIGNPFGVGQTVTMGIVSALGRNQLGINTFENFIQTDAAINPGNSGGALVDAAGNLVGINTAIFSRSGGSLGIGFAIPADTAREVMRGLIKDGHITRGWIGVEPQDLTPEIAASLRLPVRQGVLITGVLQDGPAFAGGMRPGDVVVKIGDTPIANQVQLLSAVAALEPSREATVSVLRGDRPLELTVVVGRRPARPDAVRE